MEFQIPEPGSSEMVDLLCRLEQARSEHAGAWVVVVIDDETNTVSHVQGPFEQGEQALVAAGEYDASWKAHADPEEGDWTYAVVPIFGADE